MTARDQILNRLRTTLARTDLRFPPPEPMPLRDDERSPLTSAPGGGPELPARFVAEIEALHGTADVVESPAEARLALINRLQMWYKEEEAAIKGARLPTGHERKVLGWDPRALPLESVADALADMGFELVAPKSLDDAHAREMVRHIRFGLTSAQAAFAATASVLLAHGQHMSRVAGLLPYRHIVLLPISRLYPNVESWLAERRETNLLEFTRRHSNITLISGPSKSADIEMNLTLGVHGPRHLHVILFNDLQADDEPWVGVVTYDPEEDETLPAINPFAAVPGDERPRQSSPARTAPRPPSVPGTEQ